MAKNKRAGGGGEERPAKAAKNGPKKGPNRNKDAQQHQKQNAADQPHPTSDALSQGQMKSYLDTVLISLLHDDRSHPNWEANVNFAAEHCARNHNREPSLNYISRALEAKASEQGLDAANTERAISQLRIHIIEPELQVIADGIATPSELQSVLHCLIKSELNLDPKVLREVLISVADTIAPGVVEGDEMGGISNETPATEVDTDEVKIDHANQCLLAFATQAHIAHMPESARVKQLKPLFKSGKWLFIGYVMNALKLDTIVSKATLDPKNAYHVATEAWNTLLDETKGSWKQRAKLVRGGDTDSLSEHIFDEDVNACVESARAGLVEVAATSNKETKAPHDNTSAITNAPSNIHRTIEIKREHEEDGPQQRPRFFRNLTDRTSQSPNPNATRDAHAAPKQQHTAFGSQAPPSHPSVLYPRAYWPRSTSTAQTPKPPAPKGYGSGGFAKYHGGFTFSNQGNALGGHGGSGQLGGRGDFKQYKDAQDNRGGNPGGRGRGDRLDGPLSDYRN